MGNQIKVGIVGDHKLFREILCMALQQHDIKILSEGANESQAFETINKLKPDVVLLDVNISEKDGINIISTIKEKSPKTKTLIFTTVKDEGVIFIAMTAGAKGCISKDIGFSDLIKAIQAVYQGELWIERKLIARFFDKEADDESLAEDHPSRTQEILTPREKEVLRILTTGCTNKEIAQALFISEKTVKSHLSSIFKKLKVSQRLHAILYAIKQGLS